MDGSRDWASIHALRIMVWGVHMWGAASQAFASFCLTQGLSLAWNFTKQPRLAGQGVPGSNLPNSRLTVTGMTNTSHHVWPWTRGSGDHTQVPMLHRWSHLPSARIILNYIHSKYKISHSVNSSLTLDYQHEIQRDNHFSAVCVTATTYSVFVEFCFVVFPGLQAVRRFGCSTKDKNLKTKWKL